MKKLVRKVLPLKVYKKMAYFKMLLQMRKFKKKYPNSRLFYSLFIPETNKRYSQHNQDYIVFQKFFKGKINGVFCDVGANHPLYINNTRYFEELGWSGYAFEPLPHMQLFWKKHRKAKFFPYAASDNEGDVTFTTVKNESGWEDMLSYVKKTSKVKYDYKTEDITVKTRVLKNVFREESITEIDYMSIDVEGHELQVIKGIDFTKVKVKVLTIENNFGGAGDESHYGDDQIRNIMFENNYILWGRIVGLDDIFVRSDFYQEMEVR